MPISVIVAKADAPKFIFYETLSAIAFPFSISKLRQWVVTFLHYLLMCDRLRSYTKCDRCHDFRTSNTYDRCFASTPYQN
ncbi:hypothetical protein IQ259_05190 [Fortiea sp. LEGE XX443]|uniref:hypothetical protein n=1 Tax=Fortiea sp. LEGE XX443 TaxID=1828611 RepID=UPI00187F548C|nr:hypothetical protein [Fortiea sp. LEGE XX443]